MATYTITHDQSDGATGSLTINISTPVAVTVSSGTFNLTVPSFTIRGNKSIISASLARSYDIQGGNLYFGATYVQQSGQKFSNTVGNSSTNATISSTAFPYSLSTGTYFNSSNPTTKTVQFVWKAQYFDINTSGGSTGIFSNSEVALCAFNVTLNAPPSFNSTQVSFDTAYVYTNLTTASVTVSSLSAQYGGSITDITLTIGTQTASRSNYGVLSIPLTEAGTFTPTVTATDSRGQTKTITLNPITVSAYTPPSAVISAERTTSVGVPDDEGTTCLITAQLSYVDAVGDLTQPTVKVDGTTTSTTWYETRTSSGVADAVNWTNYNPTSPVTLYGVVSGTYSTQTSFQIGLIPNDSESSGTEITTTLASAFYTVDFRAGGHGIAFGQPASQDGFWSNMETHLLQDTYIVGDVYINTEKVANFIVEQGTDSIWTYRKWSDGTAECWGHQDIPSTTYSANGGYRAISAGLPSGLFITTPDVVNASGRITGTIHTTMGYTSPNNSSTIQTYLINRGGSTVTQDGVVYWNVKGRWK